MKNDLILVIDMQNAYRPGQPWGCAAFDRACGRIRTLLDAAAAAEVPPAVCLTKFVSDPNGTGTWADYNVVNKAVNDDPWLSEIAAELEPYTASCPVYQKSVYSALKIPRLREAAERAERIVITGVVSECCVLSTVMEAVDTGRRVVYLKDACSGVDESYDAAVLKILDGLSPLHIDILDTAEYIGGGTLKPRSET